MAPMSPLNSPTSFCLQTYSLWSSWGKFENVCVNVSGRSISVSSYSSTSGQSIAVNGVPAGQQHVLSPPGGPVSLVCPSSSCRKVVYFDKNGAHNLPRHLVLQRVVERFEEARGVPPKCQLCDHQNAAQVLAKLIYQSLKRTVRWSNFDRRDLKMGAFLAKYRGDPLRTSS